VAVQFECLKNARITRPARTVLHLAQGLIIGAAMPTTANILANRDRSVPSDANIIYWVSGTSILL
jgi:hypothetical protein